MVSKTYKELFHSFIFFGHGARLPILRYPDSHRGAPVHLLAIPSDVKNQMENDSLWPLGLAFFLVAPIKKSRPRILFAFLKSHFIVSER